MKRFDTSRFRVTPGSRVSLIRRDPGDTAPFATEEDAKGILKKLQKRMHELAMILRRRRFERSALNLDLPEIKLEFDQDGHVSGAHKTVHDESHQIIEEFMLAANIAVAREFAYRGWPFLRRVHAPPDEKKSRMLSDFLNGLGFKVPPNPGRPQLQTLLDQVRGEPARPRPLHPQPTRPGENRQSRSQHQHIGPADGCHDPAQERLMGINGLSEQ